MEGRKVKEKIFVAPIRPKTTKSRQGTLCSSSNATKYESIAPYQDYVESRTIAHMRDDEKLFFVYFSFWEAVL